jgi:DNA invertase Pin-like site-specific DNA recombinase
MMLSTSSKVTAEHLRRHAYLYVRQSSLQQVHDHRESTARQYDLKGRAQVLGWAAEQIVVIDEDLGLSGASAVERNGFQRLVAEVGLGRVGVVMGLEVSRLARNSSDWHRLLEICALAETLILDEDGLYDPGHFNDRLLLGLKGTMSEAELHVLRARLLGGLLNKARRGELWVRPPLGFVYDAAPRFVLDPDVQVQDAVRLLFETFRRTGSALGVVRHFGKAGIRWPRRVVCGARAGEIVCGVLEHGRVLEILHNPRYAGAFVYGRRRQSRSGSTGRSRYRRLLREDWKVFLPDAHPGYISWEEFERNQATLRTNAHGYGTDRRRSPPREGVALLQGLVVCGRCGDRMTVHYVVSRGELRPKYRCQRARIARAQDACQDIPGAPVDTAVAQAVLDAVTPAALDVALAVFDELQARKVEVDRLRRAQVERAREEAELAQRQFLLVRPEHRLVADSLEARWNEKLARVAEAEEEYRRASQPDTAIASEANRARIHALVHDLPRLWHDPRTPMRERKRVLRLLIDDVTLLGGGRTIQIGIRWKGGATTTLECARPLSSPELRRTPAATVETVRELAGTHTDTEIAAILNERGIRSGTGRSFHRARVQLLREAYNIPSMAEHLRAAGWLTTPEMAVKLGVRRWTVTRYFRRGLLRAIRAEQKHQLLFPPSTTPLSQVQPLKRMGGRRRTCRDCTADTGRRAV